MWTPNAFYYDFGRPFPPKMVQTLLLSCDELLRRADKKSNMQVYEPGTGTGRIIIPLAEILPAWNFVGSELSNSMSDVFEYKVVVNNVVNARVVRSDAFAYKSERKNNLIIISSFLHSIKNWAQLMSGLLETLADEAGYICLIGEQADIYDCALGRIADGVDPNLCRFWQTYRDARTMFVGDNLENSQVGVRWDLENEEVAQHLTAHGFVEIDTKQLSWNHEFRIADLINILEERCYSSMFSVPMQVFEKIVLAVKREGWEVDTTTVSRHKALARCFGR